MTIVGDLVCADTGVVLIPDLHYEVTYDTGSGDMVPSEEYPGPWARRCVPGSPATHVGNANDDIMVGSGGNDVMDGRGGNDET